MSFMLDIKVKGGKKMMNRKGVSDVVSTVLIILLVVAAVAIIAAVVINIVKQAPAQVNAAAECQKLMQDTTISCTKGTTSSTVKIGRGFQNQDVVFVSYDAIYNCANGDNNKQTVVDTAIATDDLSAGKNTPGTASTCTDNLPASSVYILPKVKVGGVDTACPAPTSSVNCIA